MKLNQYFDSDEFKCKCGQCLTPDMNLDLLTRLTDTRTMLKEPMVIVSGYRCPEHNMAEGGVEDSAHMYMKAVDIQATNSNFRYYLIRCLILAGFKRIGIGKNIVHADVDETKPQNVIFTYYK